jgi:DNA-binding MarR family transcriptional regulator
MVSQQSGTNVEINTIIEYLSRRSLLWYIILEMLYDHCNKALAVYEMEKKYIEKYGKAPPVVIHTARAKYILEKLESMGLVRRIKIKGLRGLRWYITDKGIKVFERLQEVKFVRGVVSRNVSGRTMKIRTREPLDLSVLSTVSISYFRRLIEELPEIYLGIKTHAPRMWKHYKYNSTHNYLVETSYISSTLLVNNILKNTLLKKLKLHNYSKMENLMLMDGNSHLGN